MFLFVLFCAVPLANLTPSTVKYLQCKADIIFQVSQMQHVTCATLYNIQEMVSKSLESTWYSPLLCAGR